MTDPLFLVGFPDDVSPGQRIEFSGDEAHHAMVKRIGIGEYVLVANGTGVGVRGLVVHAARDEIIVEVEDVLAESSQAITWGVVQALAKGDRGELAVQMATELGARVILAWQAARCVVRWHADRGDKALGKWRATAREAAKQSRRFRVPQVDAATTRDVISAIDQANVALVLHEAATKHIADIELPTEGAGLLIVGPEGGIAPNELDEFLAAGAQAVSISDAVLRTSTAAAVALGQLDVMAKR